MTVLDALGKIRKKLGSPADRAHGVLVLAVLLAGIALRCVAIDNPSYAPHATRQYRSAIIARATYYELSSPRDDALGAAAKRAAAEKGTLEVPLTETLAAVGYAVIGRETPVVPRLLASSFWLFGGLCVYALARMLVGREAALVALAYQVLSPHAVVIGRSFQPEALFVGSMAGALYLMVRHHRSLSVRDLCLAGAATALSILAKPMSVFFLVPAFLSLGWLRHGPRGLATHRASYAFLALAVGAPAAYYAAGSLLDDSLREQASMSFDKSAATAAWFWRGWAEMLGATHGLAVALLSLLGVIVAPRGAARALLVALWLGYVAYGFVFAYHIATHAYYQAPLSVAIALSLASLAVALFRLVRSHAAELALQVGLLVALTFQSKRQAVPQYERTDRIIQHYDSIGRTVKHSSRVVYLSPRNWGSALLYHGQVAGWFWATGEQNANKEPSARQDVRTLQRLIRNEGAEYFVATSLNELKSQDRLFKYLERKHRLVEMGKRHAIYDLRGGETPRAEVRGRRSPRDSRRHAER
jgi:hypothetical protein